jgi:hypothetical protein
MTRTLLACLVGVIAFSIAAAAQVQIYSTGPAIRAPQRPTGKITGVVVDENGAPTARVLVEAMAKRTMPDGTIAQVGWSSRPTDETGRFTIEGVPPQPVLVAALPPVRPFGRPGFSQPQSDEPVYAITYYPGITNANQARTVMVPDGGEQAIVIQLRRVQPFHVRGTVSSITGRSAAGLQVMLQQMFGSGGGTRNGGYVHEDGTFDVSGVAPGIYTLTTRVSMEPNSEFAAQKIEVVDHDLDVPLTLGTGGAISGRIVFEEGSPGPAPLGASVFIGPVPGQMMAMGRPMGPISVADDWTFQARGLYGAFRIGVPTVLMGQYRPVRFEFDGRNIGTGNISIEVREGEHELIMYFAPVAVRR